MVLAHFQRKNRQQDPAFNCVGDGRGGDRLYADFIRGEWISLVSDEHSNI
ncbi:hypothetical protein [Vibrio vulnificus YJ016]|uniref:Uncharacterized protein n=1 Tax=Vibrio vulnificus (strain YJ016) TaxID=196600 RepID=Q7MJM3_VIBVY|nr:hypothetical protein [Vibrio vulnificus YJ016]